MEGPRAPRETELPGVFKFLNESLRPDHSWSINTEYPIALSRSNIHNIRIITENDRVLSHAVLKPLIIKTPLLIYKVGAIGSVVTASDRQGQGLSSQILEACLAEAQTQECDFAILWTNLYDFYRRLGFELAGFEESVVIENEFAPPATNLKFMKGAQVAPEAILRLYSQHTVGSARTAEEIRKYLQIPNSTIHTAWDPKGQLMAYAVEGKGADLTDYIHEWGGQVTALISLFSHLRTAKGKPYTVIVPNHSVNLLTALQRQPITINQGYLGMIKIVNPTSFFNKVIRAARSLSIPDLVLEKTNEGYLVGIGTDTRKIADEKELVQFIFGPGMEFGFLPSSQEKFDRLFPLPLWFWGWDSI